MSTPSNERTWAILAHLSGFLGYFTGLGHIIAPLVIWLVHRDQSPLVEREAKEALNFQLSMTLYSIIAGVLCFVLIGFLLLPAILLLDVVCMIIAAVKVSEGATWRYPLTIRLVK